MPQTPLNQIAKTPSGALTLLNADAEGNLKTSGGLVDTVVQAVGTIANTGTFQAAMAANPARKPGGAIINAGSHQMNVAFAAHTAQGTITAGTFPVGNSTTLIAAGTLLLGNIFPGSAYTGEISIEGTATDTFITVENS